MKLLNQSIIAISALGLATVAMAADPIVGKWKTSEGATVQITQSGNTFNGKIIATKSGKHVGNMAISNLKADGGGKYSGGKGKHPVFGKVKMSATISGKTMKVTGKKGPVKKTQKWTKL